jgi:hypothetical protein
MISSEPLCYRIALQIILGHDKLSKPPSTDMKIWARMPPRLLTPGLPVDVRGAIALGWGREPSKGALLTSKPVQKSEKTWLAVWRYLGILDAMFPPNSKSPMRLVRLGVGSAGIAMNLVSSVGPRSWTHFHCSNIESHFFTSEIRTLQSMNPAAMPRTILLFPPFPSHAARPPVRSEVSLARALPMKTSLKLPHWSF